MGSQRKARRARRRPRGKTPDARRGHRHVRRGDRAQSQWGRRLQVLRSFAERALAVVICFAFAFLVGWVVVTSAEPPSDVDDLCEVFREKPRWQRAAAEAAERWGVSEAALLAIVFQESSFRRDARPPRALWLGVLPGFRPSSAYGFGQVLDATWQEYLEAGPRRGARRDRMEDVLDFIGWYATVIERRTGVPRGSVRDLYLAYHEGPAGFARGDHLRQRWLLATAARVERRAHLYERQYAACVEELEGASWFPSLP